MQKNMRHLTKIPSPLFCLWISVFLSACGATLPETQDSARHIEPPEPGVGGQIPEVVQPLPAEIEPEPLPAPQLYSVLAQDLPIRELLFTMARDAAINIDVHPDVSGLVSLNAIDQSLPQILDRISRQVSMRWSIDSSGNLLIEPDNPYWHNYRVDYVNVERIASTQAGVSSSLSGAGGETGGANSSISTINQNTGNSFWTSLRNDLNVLVTDGLTAEDSDLGNPLIINQESGVISVRAKADKHSEVQAFLNFVETRALQQVLIEATVVEVNLNDSYQSGVDWQRLAQGSDDISFTQQLTPANFLGGAAPSNVLTVDGSDITGTLSLLSQFGDLQVLSSPKIMALNNQAAMLRVVDNRVYFNIDVEPAVISNGTVTPATFTSTVNTVPVGFVMNIVPQIGENDQVTLNVRPTISRILRFVNDPNPALADAGVTNPVPEVQIREIESILKVYSGQIAVLGGLMQDSLETNIDGVPTLSRLPGVGSLFSYREENASKTELLVFIRPIVVQQPSLGGDLQQFREYLPENGLDFRSFEFESESGLGFQ